jgi:hypothetical protein
MTLTVQAPEYFTIGPVPSAESAVFTGVLYQSDGVTPIAVGMLQTLSLTLVDVVTRAVINSRDDQNVLNQGNGVTVDVTLGTGALKWIISPADNPFVRTAPPPSLGEVEQHEAVFKWTWSEGGTPQSSAQKVFILIESYQNVDKSDSGSGGTVYSDFVYQPDGVTPVDDALVWVTTDAAGAALAAGPQRTTPTGQFKFTLSSGAYYLWVNSPSFAPSSANPITV